MINTYQNNQWNSRLETKYCYIVQKLRNSGVESSTQSGTVYSTYTKRNVGGKIVFGQGGGKKGDKEREKDYKRRYLVSELEEIKEALARETELPETGE
ncbi:hypothetical protein G9A89_018105 [Geosiphon pyriformis]|nr:hypothetical protein G9A89_018105 [Geosiphon pyriformis]